MPFPPKALQVRGSSDLDMQPEPTNSHLHEHDSCKEILEGCDAHKSGFTAEVLGRQVSYRGVQVLTDKIDQDKGQQRKWR